MRIYGVFIMQNFIYDAVHKFGLFVIFIGFLSEFFIKEENSKTIYSIKWVNDHSGTN